MKKLLISLMPIIFMSCSNVTTAPIELQNNSTEIQANKTPAKNGFIKYTISKDAQIYLNIKDNKFKNASVALTAQRDLFKEKVTGMSVNYVNYKSTIANLSPANDGFVYMYQTGKQPYHKIGTWKVKGSMRANSSNSLNSSFSHIQDIEFVLDSAISKVGVKEEIKWPLKDNYKIITLEAEYRFPDSIGDFDKKSDVLNILKSSKK